MAIAPVPRIPAAGSYDSDTDYGSDLDDEQVSELFSRAESQPLNGLVLTSIDSDPVIEHASARLLATEQLLAQKTAVCEIQIDRESFDQAARSASEDIRLSEESQATDENDTRSPLERFRTSPKKPLSVTDIVSPAWCEQQYLFSLSKYGRVKRTPAMRQGSSVHKVLEEQVHTSVPVEVQTREDMFGLRLWNVIQGLRSLRATGLTRELAVWGVIDGLVVNGIIDEVSNQPPEDSKADEKEEDSLETHQTTLESFLKATTRATRSMTRSKISTYYICDVKTRQSRTLPPADSRLRPVHMQLMLYHRLISDLITGTVDPQIIFKRYRLDSEATFSDVFIAEVSKLDNDLDYDDAEIGSTQDSVTELLEHNTLAALWQHMVDEYAKTIPTTKALASVVSAEFRSAFGGGIIGRRVFKVDKELFDSYVSDEIAWWRGERPTKGVEIEEAFKCRICDFADDCTWRKDKMDDLTQKARSKREAREKKADG